MRVVPAIGLLSILLFAASCNTLSGPAGTTSETSVGAQMSDQELSALLVGNTITLDDNAGNAYLSYGSNGRYVHRDARGRSVGTYRITSGRVCVTFVSGHSRCDTYLRAAGAPSYYFQNGDGTVYRVVAVGPASPRVFARR